MNDPRIEAFVDKFCQTLAREMQEELRQELRDHLLSRAEAYEELGDSPEHAVTEALTRFGGEAYLRQWRGEWARVSGQLTLRGVWEAVWPALRLSLTTLLLTTLSAVCMMHIANDSSLVGHFLGALFGYFMVGIVVLPPLALGLAQSRQNFRHATLGMFVALAAEAAGFGVLWEVANTFLPEASSVNEGIFTLAFLATVWMPLACAAAAVSGWWTRRSQARRLA